MTLTQQIQTLQNRGLIIADTNKAEQALDAILVRFVFKHS